MSCKVLVKVGEDLITKTFEVDQDAMDLYYSAASGAEQSEEGVKDTFESLTIKDTDQGLKEVKIDLNKISWVGMQELGGEATVEGGEAGGVEGGGDTVEGGGDTAGGDEGTVATPTASGAEGPTG